MKRYKEIKKPAETNALNKLEIIKFYQKLSTKSMRKFKGDFDRKEFGSLDKMYIMPSNEFYDIAQNNQTLAFFRVRDFSIYVNADTVKNPDFSAIMLHELAHTRNYRLSIEELIKEIDEMKVILEEDNFWGGDAYSQKDSRYELQETHSNVYVRFKMMGHTL
jgi:hypothetical protein